MRKFRPEYTAALALAAACFGMACHPPSFLGSGMRNHPLALVGQWVDSSKSTPTDTSLWLLDASGNDDSQHIRLESGGAMQSPRAATFVATDAKHYGYWYFQGNLNDSADRAICFTNRPGRSAPTCRPFALDSVRTSAGVRRRLVVQAYQGAHNTSDRVLLWRFP
jgi:hypothetical protein